MACVGPLATGCSDDTGASAATETTSTSGSSTVMPTTGTTDSTTVTPTDTTTTGPTTGPTTGSSSTSGGDLPCATFLCGLPAGCCGADDECLGGACVAACSSGVRCGDDDSICCNDGEVCLGDTCTLPLGPCRDADDCGPESFCEPILGQCLPQPDAPGCDAGGNKIEVALEWEWTADQVVSTPMIADVDGDGAPDVAVSTTAGLTDAGWPLGEVVLLDGETGAEKWRISHDPVNMRFGSNGRATLAVGDVDGDAMPDIVYAGRPDANKLSLIHAVDGQGNLLWTSRLPDDSPAAIQVGNGSATLVNLDGDPAAEVVFGAAIFDHDGLLVWNQEGQGGVIGTPLNNGTPIYPGGLATLADLDGDDSPELVTGREAWKIDWVDGDPPVVTLSQFWQNVDPSGMGNDGWPAVADLDGNGTPEVVLTAWPAIKVLNGQTGALWCGVDPSDVACVMNPLLRTQPIPIKGGNLGGPATIADFDGDGRPEAAISGGKAVAVYDFNRAGEEVVKLPGEPKPASGAIYARWMATIQDNSSAATGSSAFDFHADGSAELVHQDECFARIFDGATGEVRFELMSSSSTIHEYPLVADVDGDDESELLLVANLGDPPNLINCYAETPGYKERQGVYLYRPESSGWAPTRPLWTQHSYHVTNAEASGNPPLVEMANWTVPGLNNFRQQLNGAVNYQAVDVSLSLAGDLAQCPAELVLVATVRNEGALGVPAGVEVRFYEGINENGTLLGTASTAAGIVPGGQTQVTWTVPGASPDMAKSFFAVVDPGAGGGTIQECEEDDNRGLLTKAACPG